MPVSFYNDNEMSPTIGEQLKAAREARKLSLDDAFKATRIRIPYLEALENDDLEALPSKVHARGFLRLYASFLEITPEINETNQKNILQDQPQDTVEKSIESEIESEPVVEAPVVTVHEKAGEEISEQKVENPLEEPTYYAIYREIGEKLRKQREKISLSIDDISLHTRLKIDYLELIESGRMDELPSPVQARGMISNYSEFLNLDTEALLSRFADALQLKRLENLPVPAVKEENDENEKEKVWEKPIKLAARVLPVQAIKRLMTPDLIIGGGLILLLLILVIWGAMQVFTPSSLGLTPTAPSISQILLNTGTSIPGPTTLPEIMGTAEPGFNGEASTKESPAVEGTLAVNTGTQPIQVYVIANQRALLRVIVDGSEKLNERVLPGNAYQFSGFSRIELLTGNGAAIRVIFNQTDMGILGDTGEVVNLVFTRSGISTATPSQKPTATRTRAPTLTLKPSPTPTVTLYVP